MIACISKQFFGWDVGYNGTHLEKIIISQWHFGFAFVQRHSISCYFQSNAIYKHFLLH
jgi:hypothetical protein